MNVTLPVLKRDAAHAAYQREHIQIKWHPSQRMPSGALSATGTCRTCGKEVTVLTKVQPNQTHIGGTAVSTNCVSTSPSERKKFGTILRKEILSELEYLDALEQAIHDLKRDARNGDPFKLYDTAKAVQGNLDTFPAISKVIKIDFQW